MGADIPKPYLKLGDKTILEHTLSGFTKIKGLRQVIIPASEEYREVAIKIAEAACPHADVQVVPGGEERQNSIRNALAAVQNDVELIAIHDAVRPFIDKKVILECIEKAHSGGAAIAAVRVKDTIKKADEELKITATPERNTLWQAQTPQVFRRNLITEAYRLAESQGFKGTDDASVAENAGSDVYIVEGSPQNFKLTFPFDFKIAEILMESKGDTE